MRTLRMTTRLASGLAVLALILSASACGGDSSEEVGGDFTEAIPNDDILDLTLSETSGQALTLEQALEGQPSRVADHARKTADRIKEARSVTHQIISTIIRESSPEDLEDDGLDCQLFKHDDGVTQWTLRSCLLDRRAKRFAFALEGSDGQGETLNVMKGEGSVLNRFDGKRRGAGIVGYDLDNLNTLRGEGPTGRVAIGYRAAGRFRQITTAMKNFKPSGSDEDFSAVYRYNHVLGKGGVLKFAFKADVVSTEAGELSEDSDGVDEFGRVALAYSRTGKARVAGILCGGSLGEGDCVKMRECFESDNNVSFGALFLDDEGRPDFDSTSCPGVDELPILVEEAPSQDELAPSEDEDATVPGPEIEEPSVDASLEE